MDNIYHLYSVYDKAAQAFGPIFEAVNEQVAARNFYLMLKKIDVQFHGEYELYHIGVFDNKKGEIEPENMPRQVITKIEGEKK